MSCSASAAWRWTTRRSCAGSSVTVRTWRGGYAVISSPPTRPGLSMRPTFVSRGGLAGWPVRVGLNATHGAQMGGVRPPPPPLRVAASYEAKGRSGREFAREHSERLWKQLVTHDAGCITVLSRALSQTGPCHALRPEARDYGANDSDDEHPMKQEAGPVALRALSAAVDSSTCFLISTLLLRELSRNQVSKKTLGRRTIQYHVTFDSLSAPHFDCLVEPSVSRVDPVASAPLAIPAALVLASPQRRVVRPVLEAFSAIGTLEHVSGSAMRRTARTRPVRP